MGRKSAIWLLTSAILAASAGCGRTRPAHEPAASPSPACRARGTVTEAESGQTVCLTRSGRLEVDLHGTRQNPWSPIRLDGTALRRAPSGKEMLALGVTGGFFAADHDGTARLTSTRSCGRPAPPGNCASPRTFEITVVVR
jgi:hypothetical protein